MEERGRDWFVGVDWAEWARAHDLRSRSGWHTETSQMHHVFVIDAQGRKMGERGFAHGGEGLAEMAACIEKQTGAAPDAAPTRSANAGQVRVSPDRFHVHAFLHDRFAERATAIRTGSGPDEATQMGSLIDKRRRDPVALAAAEAPFGGIKASGMGREGGPEGLAHSCNVKLGQVALP